MPELVYPPVIAAAKTMFRALDLRLTVEGSHHVPRTGGAVLASNHVSYLDFIFCGYGAYESRRLVRFMAKHEVFAHKVSGPLMRGMKHIPVNRRAGAGSYNTAVDALRRGEVVGVFPEATISRSFLVKELKNGAARMSQEAAVPLLPVALWGTQRLWTKGRRRTLTRRHTPITILIGEPMDPTAYPDANASDRRAEEPAGRAGGPGAAGVPGRPGRCRRHLVAAGEPRRHRADPGGGRRAGPPGSPGLRRLTRATGRGADRRGRAGDRIVPHPGMMVPAAPVSARCRIESMNRAALVVIDVQESFRQRPIWADVSNPDIVGQVDRLVAARPRPGRPGGVGPAHRTRHRHASSTRPAVTSG